jgi:hypothetical protein
VRRIFAAAILLTSFGAAPALNANEPIRVSVYPAVTVANGEARLRVLVERSEQNRSLSWEVDGRDYYRSSAQQIDGADAPRTWLFYLKDLPVGSYEVRATVTRSDRSESSDSTVMRVVGPRKD